MKTHRNKTLATTNWNWILVSFLMLCSLLNAQTEWDKYENNPIMYSTPGTFDAVYISQPSVLFVDGVYRMWYSGHDGSCFRIGYATSENGISWDKKGVVLNPTTGWEGVSVLFPCVIYDEGKYKMWYAGHDGSSGQMDIGYTTSEYGITWDPRQRVLCGSDLGGHVLPNTVIKEGSTFRMWFTLGKGDMTVWHAISADGITWSGYQEVLSLGNSGEWDDFYAYGPSVIYSTEKDICEMWYTGASKLNAIHGEIGYASSKNGLDFTPFKHPDNPIFRRGLSNEWDNCAVHNPSVLYINNQYHMWYESMDHPLGVTHIGYATSGLPILRVMIDIKPGSKENPINLKSKGNIPVAIVTTSIASGDEIDFDATTVDPLSVRFGPIGAKITHDNAYVEDIDQDGDLDLMLHFKTQETGIQVGEIEASLTGLTYEGLNISGSDNITVSGGKIKKTLSSSINTAIPESYSLCQNYPNPFNPTTMIRFGIPQEEYVSITVYNISGEKVRKLSDSIVQAGYHELMWDGNNDNGMQVPTGIYFCKISTRNYQKSIRMLFLK